MKNDNGSNAYFKRSQLIDRIDLVILQLQERLSVQRFRPNEADNVKLEYIKVLLQAIEVKNKLLSDKQQDIYYEQFNTLIPAGSESKESLFDF